MKGIRLRYVWNMDARGSGEPVQVEVADAEACVYRPRPLHFESEHPFKVRIVWHLDGERLSRIDSAWPCYGRAVTGRLVYAGALGYQ